MSGSDVGKSSDQSKSSKLIPLRKAAQISGLTQEHLTYLIRIGKLWGSKMESPIWFTTEEAVREYLARDRKPGPKPRKST